MNKSIYRLPLLFLLARLILFLSLPLEGIRGYGDYWNFFHLAELGWPFFDLWVEFPPIFPFLSSLLFQLAGGRQHAYEYLLAITLSLFQAGNIYLFLRLAEELHERKNSHWRVWTYFALLVGLFYGWGYFDPLAVCATLLGVNLFLDKRDFLSGVSFAFGALVKWFPILGLVLVWRRRPLKRAVQVTALVLIIVVTVYGVLAILSPEMTLASLRAQFGRGSWETVWALLDGNLSTGNLGSHANHVVPGTASISRDNPSRISPWLTLIPFAALGGWLYLNKPLQDDKSEIAFLGLAWSVFFLWSPGWSPQWVLYLLPLLLLTLPQREAILMGVVWVFISLLEWPVLLSRGFFRALWLLIPIRTLLLILLAFSFWQQIKKASTNSSSQGKNVNAIP